MRKFLIGSAAFLGLTAGASAADLARPAPPMVPVFTWTGFYIGANAGYIWSEGSINDHCFSPGGVFFGAACQNPQFVTSPEGSGWLAGGQVGYNYQFRGWGGGNWVFGVEADLQATDLSRANNQFNPLTTLVGGVVPIWAVTYRGQAEMDWFGTVRGRLGFAWDRLLVYGTGGAIFANVTTSHLVNETIVVGGPGVFQTVATHDSILPGWIVGGGFEYAFTNNLSLKVEGMYYELQPSHAGGPEINLLTTTPSGFRTGTDVDHTGFLVRGGINWRFWGM
jgi:outer membrane immunogenic protein